MYLISKSSTHTDVNRRKTIIRDKSMHKWWRNVKWFALEKNCDNDKMIFTTQYTKYLRVHQDEYEIKWKIDKMLNTLKYKTFWTQ